MPSLNTQHDFQSVGNLPFCYLCGRPFEPDDKKDRDHVPPKTVFAKPDRQNPLVLMTHTACNQSHSAWDQLTGEFISLLHDTDRTRQKISRHVRVLHARDRMLVIQNVPLKRIIARFIRGFHAALYREHLPFETNLAIQLPLPSGHPADNGIRYDGIHLQYPAFIETLKKNRIAGNIDEITCFSGKCRYFCVWSKLDDNRPFCLFALRVYDWEDLGDTTHFPRRACVGCYGHSRTPANATRETTIEIPCTNLDPLDPFSD